MVVDERPSLSVLGGSMMTGTPFGLIAQAIDLAKEMWRRSLLPDKSRKFISSD
jgi:hypothetical protein